MSRQKKKVSLEQVLELVEQLSPQERGELRRRLDESRGLRWDSLVKQIAERNKDLPPITEEEIYQEFTEHRRAKRAEQP
jgi:hypothetical protein